MKTKKRKSSDRGRKVAVTDFNNFSSLFENAKTSKRQPQRRR